MTNWTLRYSAQDAKKTVWKQLKKNYRKKDMDWVKEADWRGPVEVTLKEVNFSTKKSWRAYKQPSLVREKIQKIKDGRKKPVVLVDAPKNDKYIIIDGHHRALAYEKMDRPMLAFIAKVDKEKGDWDYFHSKQKPSKEEGNER